MGKDDGAPRTDWRESFDSSRFDENAATFGCKPRHARAPAHPALSGLKAGLRPGPAHNH
jgi:hypothetical protein